EYSLKDVGIFNGDNTSADYLAKNPFGKVPTLEIDGEFLYETAAVTEYLDAAVANNKFSPSDLLSKARMRQIMAIVDSYLYPASISTIVIQRLIVPSQGGTPDEDAVQSAVAPAKTAAEAIEALTVGSPYLLGSDLSIADFYLIPVFLYLSRTPEFATITAQTPKLRAWWDNASQLPTIQKISA
ncbi:glutathione S-transferase family protein, partial [Leptolyngbya sp. FACHB-36]|uniref:glutathione S-transferase family protein n=1 Tax=Leptolyngbya sp. FACHB-36 TaxID=2692808 RepID=UPI0016801963